MYYTYVLRSQKDGNLYSGHTNNLRVRFELHQAGKVESTAYRRPLELIYYEACRTKQDAIKREKYFKTHYGRMFLRRRIKSDSTGLTKP